jgi:hypothetical protein
MPCKHYKDALIEAAATCSDFVGAADLSPELAALRAHLAACAACGAAFAEEQSLFAAIDSGLHASVNAEVPPSLLPRVRAGLDGVAVAHTRWGSGWFALVGAAAVAAALFFTVSIRQNNLRTQSNDSATTYHPAVPPIVSSAGAPLSAGSSKRVGSVSQPGALAIKNSVVPKELLSRESTPEILVPRDQELLVASYAQQWDSRKHAPLVAGEADQTAMAFLEIPPIQIPGLDVKPLAEGDSQ